ncbi:hypothetical protein [Bradyrhizobium aeschynomenes]|uniref:hypothetical protein n=1 Tax=Bradyrhizobium aeschynomenes TaxID=2734909 RepID=UPI00155369BF|nr:hypothetical protein [Bradyrhizobium aeschynomenes]NPV21712.1 hypothetical protein [Bradyrhizobium aeschynomenes]
MKRISLNRVAALAVAISATFLLTPAHATVPSAAPFDTIGAPVQTAGLAWRCGKNNPAWWGTFGNGCLKQKRAARRNASFIGLELSQPS